METKINNIPEINPAEIINHVATLNQYGRGGEWHGVITARQFNTLCAAVQAAGGESKAPRAWNCENYESRRRACSGLELPGVSELVALYDVVCYWQDDKKQIKCYAEHVTPYLVINNRAYFVPCYGNEKPGTTYELFLPHFDPARVEVSYNSGWKFSEPAPAKAGKATAKKLAAWVDYLDRQNASRAAWLKEGEDKRAAFFARLNAAGVEYKQYKNRVTIYNGILKMEVEIGEHDIYPRRPEYCGAAISDSLSLMLDSEITITPRRAGK